MSDSSIFLRYIETKDAEQVLDWENNEENWAVSENDSPYSIYDILVLIGELQNIQKAKQARWMICSNIDEEAIGNVDLTEIDFENKQATVGILIADKETRNKGFASEALQLIEVEAMKLGVEKLNSTIHQSNKVSITLFLKSEFKKIGLQKESDLKDDEYIDVLVFEKWLKK